MLDFKAPQTQEELDALIKEEVGKATDGIRAKMTGEQAALKSMKAELEQATAKMKQVEDAAAQDKAEKEKAELLASGKYDEALKKVTEGYETKTSELQKSLDASRERIRALVIDREIIKHATDAIDPEDVLLHAKKLYDFEIDDSDPRADVKISIKRKDGSLFFDDKGNPGNIELIVSKTLAEKPHLAKPASQGGAGSQSGVVKKTGAMTLEEQIQEAHEKGDRAKVVKLKMQLQSQGGPHTLLAGPKSGG